LRIPLRREKKAFLSYKVDHLGNGAKGKSKPLKFKRPMKGGKNLSTGKNLRPYSGPLRERGAGVSFRTSKASKPGEKKLGGRRHQRAAPEIGLAKTPASSRPPVS